MREDGEAAPARANRGRPSPRRLPAQVRHSILRRARTTDAGFNDHHLCEKLCQVEGFSLSRETLRRLLRQAVWARLASVALRLIASAACPPRTQANWCNSTVLLTTGSKAEAPA
ncbi:MAG TPA: hypothetical protein VIX37_06010 [Candidatus Sulfotelmatobacter sp.]